MRRVPRPRRRYHSHRAGGAFGCLAWMATFALIPFALVGIAVLAVIIYALCGGTLAALSG